MDLETEQADELEALRAIFEDDFTDISSHPPCFMIKCSNLDVELTGPLYLKIVFSEKYPEIPPNVEIPMRGDIISTTQHKQLLQHLNQTAEATVGMAMIFTLVDAAKEWLSENIKASSDSVPELEELTAVDQVEEDCLPKISSAEITGAGGRWEYVVGLVGKPSAGKSTFFNAATKRDLAKTAAHPFTTIEPNISKAFYSAPCPCQKMKKLCQPEYGHNYKGERLLPILLKDVAGLVPGAADGKGRGNRFLNDLCDADVLIHIIDISGQTNEKGEPVDDYDPALDVKWLNEEIHRWIYDNVMNKWESIVKRPNKILDMFTGYHANKSVIHAAFHNAGIDTRELAVNLPTWNNQVVHNLVKEFIKIRFPMLLVLNKADVKTARENVLRFQELLPETSMITVSSWSECFLQNLQKEHHIKYEFGSEEFQIITNNEDQSDNNQITFQYQEKLDQISENILKVYGSTNVHNAVSMAVSLKPPVYAFPIQDLETLEIFDCKNNYEGKVLYDCVSLKPGTTVDGLYQVMLHQLHLVNGKFVRAETVDEHGKRRQVRKDEIINESNNIIKIMTTRKSS